MVTLKEIKEECSRHKNCIGCPLFTKDEGRPMLGDCLIEVTPCVLDLEEIEKRLYGQTET